MKFYFCEKCGKRLTEHDLDAGAGRDKKLKGVFCRDCAVGVMTMETLPLTDEDAQKVLEKEASSSDSTTRRPKRRSSAYGAPAGVRDRGRRERDRTDAEGRSGKPARSYGAVVGAALAVAW